MSILGTFGQIKRRLNHTEDGSPAENTPSGRKERAHSGENDQLRYEKATMKRQFNGIPSWTIE